MLRYKNTKTIELHDWDTLVRTTYGKPYSFQQQNGCQDRGSVSISIPETWDMDEEMNDSIPEVINGNEMGVKFAVWLARDPKQIFESGKDARFIDLFWDRNFYPDLQTVANDLYAKGLVEAGDYTINIDW